MITMQDVNKSFDGREVLRGLDLVIGKGERVCISGESGCGKTTVLRLIAGLEKPDSGIVQLCDKARLSVVFQEDRLLPWRTALENVTAVGVDSETAREMLARLGLAGEEEKYPDQLSGGMRRRVAIARALAVPADIFLLDEAIQGLDDGTAGRVLEVLDKALEGRTAVIVSHDSAETAALARRTVCLSNGRVLDSAQ